MFSFLKISVASSRWVLSTILVSCQYSMFARLVLQGQAVLLDVPGNKRQVEDQSQPVAVDEEEEGQEAVDGGLRDDVGVEAVAEFDGVDVVAGGWSAGVSPRVEVS
jgi:hypothetical protein